MSLQRRQQDGGSPITTAPSASASASASNGGSPITTAPSASGSGSDSGSGTGTGTGPSTTHFGITGGPGFNPNATSVSTVPANGAPGEIVFTLPPLQSTSYYKIAPGESITFGWNFSYLAVAPTSITVSAACENGNTYPVGPTDGVIPGDSQSVVWYPYGYQVANPSLPLAQASYTLLVFGQGGPSAIPTPGYLAPNDQLRFALYNPQAYTPLASGWTCQGCGGAFEQFKAHPASIALLTTLLVIFLSGFTTLRRVMA